METARRARLREPSSGVGRGNCRRHKSQPGRFYERAFATPSRGAASRQRFRARGFILPRRGWDGWALLSLLPRWGKWSATGSRADVILIRNHLGESVNHAARRAARGIYCRFAMPPLRPRQRSAEGARMPCARKSAGPYEFLPVALWTPRRDEATRRCR